MSDLANIKQWLQEELTNTGETLTAVVVGRHDRLRFRKDPLLPDENVVLSPQAGLAKLDVEFDSGFGGADCFPMFAWTENRVYFIHEYDGATSLAWVPRNPCACVPDFSGCSELTELEKLEQF